MSGDKSSHVTGVCLKFDCVNRGNCKGCFKVGDSYSNYEEEVNE